jgi:hypothetical protein
MDTAGAANGKLATANRPGSNRTTRLAVYPCRRTERMPVISGGAVEKIAATSVPLVVKKVDYIALNYNLGLNATLGGRENAHGRLRLAESGSGKRAQKEFPAWNLHHRSNYDAAHKRFR